MGRVVAGVGALERVRERVYTTGWRQRVGGRAWGVPLPREGYRRRREAARWGGREALDEREAGGALWRLG